MFRFIFRSFHPPGTLSLVTSSRESFITGLQCDCKANKRGSISTLCANVLIKMFAKRVSQRGARPWPRFTGLVYTLAAGPAEMAARQLRLQHASDEVV